MKNYLYSILLAYICITPAKAQNTMSSPIEIGTIRSAFGYINTLNTTSYTNNYTGKSTNDVFYRFTLSVPMDIVISHCGSVLDDTYMTVLNSFGTSVYSNDDYAGPDACSSTRQAYLKIQKLAAGTYYVVSEGYGQNGVITTTILGTTSSLSGDLLSNPIIVGTYGSGFTYSDTQNTTSYSNAYVGKSTNDVYYILSLSAPMDIVVNHCGSAVGDTYLSVLNSSGSLIYSNDDYSGTGKCTSTLNSYLSLPNLAAGTYYIVSEGYSQNGNITTNITGSTPYGGLAASKDRNYILTVIPTVETTNATKLTAEQSLQTIQYFDGLGRPAQTVQRGFTPNRNDLVTMREYDSFGRDSLSWLPGSVSNNNGAYVSSSNMTFPILSTNAVDGKWDSYGRSRIIYEASPLNRVVKQIGPGQYWNIPNREIGVSTSYLTNITTGDSLSCVLYKVTDVGDSISLSKTGTYAAGELFVTRMLDEDNNRSYEFKDKLGQVVLTRQMEGNTPHDTYYIYDDFGNLRLVLPPIASDLLKQTISNTPVKDYAYIYKYDYRNRCVRKKLPGCQWIHYVYDKADRLIFTQDGEQRKKNEWTFSIPDELGRTVLTGTCKSVRLAGSATDTPIKSGLFDDKLLTADYASPNTFNGYILKGKDKDNKDLSVVLVTPSVLTVSYYDNYNFLNLSGFSTLTYNAAKESEGYGKRYNENKGYEAKGLLTGTATAQLGGTTTMLNSAMYYDNRSRLIQAKSTNHLGGVEEEYIAYNFTGQPVKKQHVHSATGKTTQTEYYTYEYDHAGRLKKTKHQLKEGTAAAKPEVMLAENNYDELGRLITSKRASQANLETTYKYNVRSWTKSISSPLFTQTLYYNESYGGSKALYNGNISAMDWTVSGDKKRGYAFKYDALSRLTAASYLENGTLTTTDGKMPNYNTTYTYDKHGNITSLTRYGQKSASASDFGIVDQFTTMTYAGNQLKKVVDGGANANFAASNDFKDWSEGKGQYTYNANGAIDKDTHKGILGIRYNSLNLPQELTVKNLSTVGKIYYTYSATGAKLKVNYLASANLANSPVHGITDQDKLLEINETTDYVGNMIYEKGSLKRILIDGGYIEGGVYYFNLTDHLGNNRVVAKADGTVIQRNHYYPFGMAFAETPFAEQGKQPYKYNGKEFDSMHGLNLYDYSARYYDGTLPRFTTVDPLAEKKPWLSPYHYCSNNPINRVDPDGMYDWDKFVFGFLKSTTGLGVAVSGLSTQYSQAKTAVSVAVNLATDGNYRSQMGNAIQTAVDNPGAVVGAAANNVVTAVKNDPQLQGEIAGAAASIVVGSVASMTKSATIAESSVSNTVVSETSTRTSGRGTNHLKPNTEATGPHSSFRRDGNGNITNTTTYKANPRNPTGFDEVKRVDKTGAAHRNKAGEAVNTPHVHENKDVRPARLDEIPKTKQ